MLLPLWRTSTGTRSHNTVTPAIRISLGCFKVGLPLLLTQFRSVLHTAQQDKANHCCARNICGQLSCFPSLPSQAEYPQMPLFPAKHSVFAYGTWVYYLPQWFWSEGIPWNILLIFSWNCPPDIASSVRRWNCFSFGHRLSVNQPENTFDFRKLHFPLTHIGIAIN